MNYTSVNFELRTKGESESTFGNVKNCTIHAIELKWICDI